MGEKTQLTVEHFAHSQEQPAARSLKPGMRNRVELTRYAIKRDLVEP
jgi:hypothetical protein